MSTHKTILSLFCIFTLLSLLSLISSSATTTSSPNAFSITGIKSANLKTDIAPGIKSYQVFQNNGTYARIDTTSMENGDKTSLTVAFSKGLYYLRLLANDFCVFEHAPDLKQLNSQFQTTLPVDRKDIMIKTLMGNVVKCDARVLPKGAEMTQTVLFYFFNEVGQKWKDYNVTVYTASEDYNDKAIAKDQLVRLAVQGLEEFQDPTYFDVTRLDEENTKFPDSLFEWNIRDTCH